MSEETSNKFLLVAAYSCALAALAHIGCIVFGGSWYRVLGAGEHMAKMHEQGLWYPTVVTLSIVIVLSIWTLYALSGAGVIRRLPLLRVALIIITSILLVRAVGFVFLMPMFPENSLVFWLVSSSVCLFIGGAFLVGTTQRWPRLANK